MSRKLFQASILTLAMASPDAFALGLGGLRTQSALNQPFLAEIELLDVKPDELDTLRVMLSSPEEFERAGIERYHFLTRLRFDAEVRPDRQVVMRITSQDPIREPYLDFLVTAVWPQGRLIKNYTVLLDPPLTTASRPAPIRAPVAGSSAQPLSPAGAPTGSSTVVFEPGDGFPLVYGPVPRGTGVWRLARTKTPPGATVAQTALALYRNNQHAFIQGDINRLLADKTLTIPSRAELFALDAATADREFKAALSGEPVHRAPLAPMPARAEAELEQPRLRLAGEPSGTPIARGTPPSARMPETAIEQDVLLAMEASESARQETSELRDRIRELEGQLSGIQELLQLRNAELARLRELAPPPGAPLPQPQPSMPEPEPSEAPGGEDLAAQAPDAVLSAEPAAPLSELMLPELEGDIEAPASALTEPEPPETRAPADVALAPEPDTVPEEPQPSSPTEDAAPSAASAPTGASETDQVAPAPVASSAPATAEETAEETQASASLWYALLLPVAGLAGLVALGIGGFAWWSGRRRKQEDETPAEEAEFDALDEFEPLDVQPETPPARSVMDQGAASSMAPPKVLAGAPGAEPGAELESDSELMPLDLHSLPDAEEAEQAPAPREGAPSEAPIEMLPPIDGDSETPDVLSEADIYLAYGRHAEAERLLRAELAREPERLDVQYKLADAYFAQGNLDGLRVLAQSIAAAGGEASDAEQWGRLQERLAQLENTTGSTSKVTAPASLAAAPDALSEDMLDLNLDSLIDNAPVEGVDDIPLLFDDSDLLLDAKPAPDAAPARRDEAVTKPSDQSDMGLDELALSLNDLEGMDGDDFKPTAPSAPTPSTPAPKSPARAPDSEPASQSSIRDGAASELLLSQWETDSGLWDENSTKIDLAQAYIDMDDKESARSILEEVLADGNEKQRAEAQAKLAMLD
ncbi:MAG: hypothetical protein JXM75_04730 [Chromatiaceae bacterium]|nr:hypothetical protein [Chromatiaceae bacterium]